MSTPERQQDSDPEKVTGYGGPDPHQPEEEPQLTDFEPDDADHDEEDDPASSPDEA